MCFVYGEISLEQDTQSYIPEAEKHPTVTASGFNKSICTDFAMLPNRLYKYMYVQLKF